MKAGAHFRSSAHGNDAPTGDGQSAIGDEGQLAHGRATTAKSAGRSSGARAGATESQQLAGAMYDQVNRCEHTTSSVKLSQAADESLPDFGVLVNRVGIRVWRSEVCKIVTL
jgi:hypothetical protein